ncbi:MAG: P-II family nitrogen regulator [Candidatus Abyssobacteria bacterium SURF_17]|uniref:P-II family nitrogen regulator n=1 Tax=Candidatus Abyssobacteria bacterium SURF_17 TaxID=2093361 RepID=A0A419EYU0_9BACT|nr:MAG: P-II family nitrogen regulator [Candidatus Abyssubacteria bacterium SURF_17]
MKAILAIIKPHKLADVTLALRKLEGLAGMTVTDVRGFGRTRAEGAGELVPDDVADFVRKSRIDIICNDSVATTIVETIRKHAHTGAHGDGKIYSWSIEKAVRISSGETENDAV